MSVRTRLFGSIALLVLIMVSMFVATWLVSGAQKDDGLVINLAGRQRMLSQKMSKEILLYQLPRLREGKADPALAAAINNSMRVFNQTLVALKEGGEAPLSLVLDNSAYRSCPPASEPVASQLVKVSGIWKEFCSHLEPFLRDEQTTEHFNWLVANNLPLLQEMDTAVTMMQSQAEGKTRMLLLLQVAAILFGLACSGLAIYTTRSIVARLQRIKEFADQLGTGNLNASAGLGGSDELGAIGGCLDATTAKLRAMFAGISDNAEGLGRNAAAFSVLSEQLLENTEGVSGKSHSVAAAAEQLSGNMAVISVAAADLNSRMGTVKATASESSENLSIITNATEEMSATIADIATNAEKARQVAGTAVANVNSASTRVDELGSAALEISKVTDVIVEIAEQTKLLALNATIEAARAGEAGKGFAVVANEVKELALQTNNAIAEIRNKVEAMQQSTDNTITEIGAINHTINAVNEIVVNIAGAVEEQSMTTKNIVENINQAVNGIREMSGNVSEAASGVAAITGNVSQAAEGARLIAADIGAVNRNTTGLNKSALTVQKQAVDLLSLGDALREEVRKFRV